MVDSAWGDMMIGIHHYSAPRLEKTYIVRAASMALQHILCVGRACGAKVSVRNKGIVEVRRLRCPGWDKLPKRVSYHGI